MTEFVHVRKHVPSGTIVLNRTEKCNALSRMMIMNLRQAFSDLHQERNVRAVILTGKGSSFCAGMDLKEMKKTREKKDALQQWHHDVSLYKDLLEQMLQFPKPIIAAVNGPALAGGAGLVLASDIAIASRDASFGLPEPKRGLVAGVVAPLLFFRLGGSLSADLLLTARQLDAEQALRINLFREIVEHDLLWARAHQIVEECAKSAPEAIQLSKRILNETIGEQLSTILSAGAAASATARTTEAAAEGLDAFLEKREPEWL
jgi:methylglutaconyl-CoA hydratase